MNFTDPGLVSQSWDGLGNSWSTEFPKSSILQDSWHINLRSPGLAITMICYYMEPDGVFQGLYQILEASHAQVSLYLGRHARPLLIRAALGPIYSIPVYL